ncbi:MAG: pseudouridine synthase [Syntrophotaleaceae bacterium]
MNRLEAPNFDPGGETIESCGQLEVLYADEHLVAVNKPAGLLVHRSPIDRRETRFAQKMLSEQLGRTVYPVHRLDKPTSGVLLFGLSSETARRMGEIFAGRGVEKTYLAVLRGHIEDEGVIDYPLVEKVDRLERRPVADRDPQSACTAFRRLGTIELPHPVGRYATSRYCLVEARPLTGRRHQLRRHFKHLFHPIVGDTRYGDADHNRFFRREFDCHRLLLAAVELSFPHPFFDRPVTVTAPLCGLFVRLLESFEWCSLLPAPWLGPRIC